MVKQINHKYLHFGPVLCATSVDLNLCKELVERGDKTTDSNVPYLAGHLNHENNFTVNDILWFVTNFKYYFIPYFKKIQTTTDKEYYYGAKPFNRILLQKLWINYMKKNEFNPPHTHGGAFSFVLYLKVPEAINKEIKNFKGTGNGPGSVTFFYGEDQKGIVTAHGVKPTEGDLWIFPASLKHMVPPFRSDETRISVSGNIYVTDELNKGLPIQPGEFTIMDRIELADMKKGINLNK